MDILKSLFGTSEYVSRADTIPDGPETDPEDVWAFTDPDARDRYEREGRLRDLEWDIRFEVMRGEGWLEEELLYKHEIQRLLRLGAVEDKGSYWYASPFPTVYRCTRDGIFHLGSQEFPFKSGDDIVFQCRMAREMNDTPYKPMLISKLQPTKNAMLCGEMGNAMKGMHSK
ncbi:MAG: hypothetical protein P1P76_04710 [Anaerolineales bacterium]|nr:hypothetical protein [Anaerolineales bacterium]